MAKKGQEKMDKKTWINIAAVTIAVVMLVFGVKECSDKQNAVRENERLSDRVDASLSRIEAGVGDLREDTKGITNLIMAHDAIVNEKLDTLKAHCGTQKPCDCKPVKKAPVKKPVAVKPAPAKPVVKPVEKPAEAKVAVEVVSGENKVVVPVDAVKPNQAVIVNGENSGTIIVNANGIVNGNAIVNGNNNTVVNGDNNKVNVDKVAEARKKYVEACAQKKVVVLNDRVQCYTK